MRASIRREAAAPAARSLPPAVDREAPPAVRLAGVRPDAVDAAFAAVFGFFLDADRGDAAAPAARFGAALRLPVEDFLAGAAEVFPPFAAPFCFLCATVRSPIPVVGRFVPALLVIGCNAGTRFHRRRASQRASGCRARICCGVRPACNQAAPSAPRA